jgi:hypothetical protein
MHQIFLEVMVARHRVPLMRDFQMIVAPQRHHNVTMSEAWEATYYVAECEPAWHGMPGALEWLTKTITALPPNQRARLAAH